MECLKFSLADFSRCLIVQALLLLAVRAQDDPQAVVTSSMEQADGPRIRPWRLPITTYPLQYHLHLTTWIHRGIRDFAGTVSIELMVQQDTAELVLHSQNLTLQQVVLWDLTSDVKLENFTYYTVDDLVVVEGPQNVTSCEDSSYDVFKSGTLLRLQILYRGEIKEGEVGFHIIADSNEGDRTLIYGATTQMGLLHARTVFPCFDEPAHKANFTLSITHGANFTALANMPALSRNESRGGEDDMVTTAFMKSPPISTYILAFAVTNYEFTTLVADGISQSAFFPPNSTERGQSALRNAVKALREIASHFDVPYSLPKLDHFLLPQTPTLAMENWGLIIYNKETFLSDLKTDVETHHRQIYSQNHELVHQWFGNLVTPAWWSQLWLSEGFAAYYAYVVTDWLYPEFRSVDEFENAICGHVLGEQSISSISAEVETPEEIDGKVGATSYWKAGCTLHMFHQAFGPRSFQEGLSNYIKTYSFSSATEDQLFHQLQLAIDRKGSNGPRNVHEIMKTWSHAESFPAVTVVPNAANKSVLIKQRSYNTESTDLWWIPLTFASSAQPNFDNRPADYFMPPVAEVTLNLSDLNITLGVEDWLVINTHNTGFYTVQYDNHNLNNLVEALQSNHAAIHYRTRKALVRNIFQESAVNRTIVLEVLKYLNKEQDSYVWIEVLENIHSFAFSLRKTSCKDTLDGFLQTMFTPQSARSYGISQENLSLGEYRVKDLLDRFACAYSIHCLAEKKQLLLEYANGQSGSIEAFEVAYGAMTLADAEFVAVLDFFSGPDKKVFHPYMDFLRFTKSDWQYQKLLNATLNMSTDQEQRDTCFHFWATRVIDYRTMNRDYTWKFLQSLIGHFGTTSPSDALELCTRLAKFVGNSMIPQRHQEKFLRLIKQCEENLLAHDYSPAVLTNKQASKLAALEAAPEMTAPRSHEDEVCMWLDNWYKESCEVGSPCHTHK